METKAPGIIVSLVLCIIASSFFVFARVYSRLSLRLFGLEDWLLTLINIILTILTFLDLKHGTGRHTWDIPASDLPPHFKLQYATGILYYMVLPITKLGICVLYQRIIDVNRTSKILIQCLIVYMIMTGLGLTIYIMNECTPISAYWNDQFGPQCWKRRSISNILFFVNAASNTFTDLCIIAIVLPVFWGLQMEKRRKMFLFGVVCIGFLAIISSIIRMVIVSRVLKSTDPAWEAADMDIWSCVECNTSLICAAAPCTRHFINKIRPHLLPTYIRQTTLKYNGLKDSNAGSKSWPMENIESRRGKPQYAMSETDLIEDDCASQIRESRQKDHENSLEIHGR
ncbi:hypothetical protein N431DRAFT_475389 [Stipitochalara longipes BDJ]|nr:hypothetical protein N431DRAFT_475389 [Stipitochalara longipes BDJ]